MNGTRLAVFNLNQEAIRQAETLVPEAGIIIRPVRMNPSQQLIHCE